MNWIFDTYSNVYNTAMMLDTKPSHHLPVAKKPKTVSAFAKYFKRG